jgi:lipoprotein-anchoring transpeptidase ErfK/SrfK
MKTAKQIGLAAAAMMVVLAAQGLAQQTGQKTDATKQAPAVEKREIVVSLEDRKLALVENGQTVKVYTVAVGKPSTPSPVGTFTIERRVENPTYHHNGKTIPPGPGNPVGTRWMGLSIKGYGIHGTNEPKSIGKAASHGCIRMAKADLEELYPQVAAGDTVELVGHPDEETARLFGNGVAPTSAAAARLAKTSPAPLAPQAPTAIAANSSASSSLRATAAILTGAL